MLKGKKCPVFMELRIYLDYLVSILKFELPVGVIGNTCSK